MHPRAHVPLKHLTPLLVLLLGALAVPTAASADTQWAKISSDYASNITVPEIGILGSTAVVTWEQDTSPSTADIVSDTFQTSPANDVANGVAGKVAEGWAEVDRTQAIVPTPSGGLQIAFAGIHSTSSADPLTSATSVRAADLEAQFGGGVDGYASASRAARRGRRSAHGPAVSCTRRPRYPATARSCSALVRRSSFPVARRCASTSPSTRRSC